MQEDGDKRIKESNQHAFPEKTECVYYYKHTEN